MPISEEGCKIKRKAPKKTIEAAAGHLEKNPRLLEISWKSFFKKNVKVIV